MVEPICEHELNHKPDSGGLYSGCLHPGDLHPEGLENLQLPILDPAIHIRRGLHSGGLENLQPPIFDLDSRLPVLKKRYKGPLNVHIVKGNININSVPITVRDIAKSSNLITVA